MNKKIIVVRGEKKKTAPEEAKKSFGAFLEWLIKALGDGNGAKR